MNNFVKRTLSGILFVTLTAGSILLSSYAFVIVFAVIVGITVQEFQKLTNQQSDVNVNLWVAATGAVMLFVSSFLYASETLPYLVFSLYGIYLVAIMVFELYRQKPNPLHNWAYFILGQVFIALPFSLLNFILYMDQYKPIILLSLFVTIWVNDTGAYLVGVTIGKHRLFERISPKKSWEGFFGGALAVLISAYVFSLFIHELSLVEWLILSEIVVVFATFGDLIESLMKRTVHVKDSGTVMPGHGGLLDRFDSMLLATPVVFIYLIYLFQ